jgi:hypothetical protein
MITPPPSVPPPFIPAEANPLRLQSIGKHRHRTSEQSAEFAYDDSSGDNLVKMWSGIRMLHKS